ncbi:type 1 glutamine amidotransferase [Rummeliibacillus sp. G93]|uniref:type 1 glutamine amidotransferase domain-containing protein n=1 Tax=Rummeliibacillus TaxID=648802 RepID=UPI00161C7449|nr:MULTISPECIES: type 1 glutamine amidotransferase domain-containing protein [Rummeliibacillus]MCM3317921.1 type 1 glutamine amidotransferase [Rummeliibacillus stabekisii]UQW97272.1 type 1 glutamine amidotransferase [Rummeliibacillus sp. G93]
MLSLAKVATVVTNLVEDVEYTEPVKALRDAGHEVVTVEKTAGGEVEGKHGTKIQVDKSIDDVKVDDFDALLIPGGFSPDQLRADERFVNFAKAFMDAKKPVFAICHGPQLLITAKTLDGRHATGYKSIQVDMENAGVNFQDKEVVVCENQLVTSRTPDDIPAFNREIVNLLK